MCRRIGACDYNPEQIAAQDPDGLAFFLADGLAAGQCEDRAGDQI
jgi:hypothetical protein